MTNACVFRVGRIVAIVLVVASACGAQRAWGQNSPGNILPNGLVPLLTGQPATSPNPTAGYQQPNMPQQAPLARLIENPDQTDGAPPFALTDQTGTIQRYVEPVPGIDLSSHVGQVVTVRNDTGATLLASQLELPPQAMRPMVGESGDRYATAAGTNGTWRRGAVADGAVQLAQYVDNDDSSVQLLPDAGTVVDTSGMATGDMMPLDGMPPAGAFPAYGEQVGPPAMVGPMYQPGMPMQYPPGMMGYPTGGVVEQADRARLSADVELSMLRPQLTENTVGNFSESYQFSPRVALGLSGVANWEARVRYWHYDHDTNVLGTDGKVGLKFNVLDVEALHRFEGRRSDFALAAGVRFAGVQFKDEFDLVNGSDLFGLTLAGDGLSRLGMFPGGYLGLVYGGRLSILGGDWLGESNSFVSCPTHNDNVLVQELYLGIELARRIGAANCHARIAYEMQNWHSDALASNGVFESIGFAGPGIEIGAEF